MKIKKFAVPLAVVGVLAVGMSAWAVTSFQSYGTTVGKPNGNGYTAYQTKSGAGAAADLRSSRAGADYVVDARLQASSGTGSWARDGGDNDTRQLWNSVQKGASAASRSPTTGTPPSTSRSQVPGAATSATSQVLARSGPSIPVSCAEGTTR